MHGLSTALPQKVRISRAEPNVAPKAKKAQPKTRRVFEEVLASPADIRAMEKGEAEIVRGEYLTREELIAKYL